jgi:hypothetical protein
MINEIIRQVREAVPVMRKVAAVLSSAVVSTVLLSSVPARADGISYTGSQELASGVTFRTFATTSAKGPMVGYLLDVDLRDPHVSVGLLHPPAIAQREPVSAMATAQHALAGINGDFFNVSETHPGVTPTGSSDGPEVADGRDLKGSVPDGQRFGPGLPPGTSTKDVIGVGTDRVARLAGLHLAGTVRTGKTRLALSGLNQYALAVGGIGAFTGAWGTVSRERAVCGTDLVRADPCSTDTAEVTLRRGVVVAVSDTVGQGPISADQTVLVGREGGADTLRAFRVGQRVSVRYHLAADISKRFRFAVGGFPILRAGTPLTGLDTKAAAVRTAAGIGGGGHRMYLVVVQPAPGTTGGMTVAELATLLISLGATAGVNLDGGGSSTLAARDPATTAMAVRNTPTDSTGERPVANGIGVFARP